MTRQRGDQPTIEPFEGPSGGWGSMRSVAEIIPREKLSVAAIAQLARQNKQEGFQCVSCAWAKPHPPHTAEFCEEGVKATAPGRARV